MSPKDYIQARQDSLGSTVASSSSPQGEDNNSGERPQQESSSYYVAWIADRPYVPELSISKRDDAKHVAAHLMELLRNFLMANSNNNDNIKPNMKEESQTAKIDPDALTVTTISGGRTNTLYLVSGLHQQYYHSAVAVRQQQHTHTPLPDEVLVRVFGAEGMIDRDQENASYAALSAAGIAPPYYGRFANGRLEGWMHGMRPLQLHELPRAAPGIATQLARLHTQFQVPTELLGDESPQPNLFADLDLWMEQALQQTNITSPPQQQEQLQSLQLADKVRPELDWLKEQVAVVLGGDGTTAAICFCHNDVLASNVLITNDDDEEQSSGPADEIKEKEKSNNIQLIDFEYGGINYRAFDIANHLNEYAGGPPDLAVPNYQLRPTPEQQRAFVRTYLETAATAVAADGNESRAVVTETAVEALWREVQIFILANHLYWGLWAVNQAATEGCEEYDYMLYAVNRIGQYWIDKEEQLLRQQQQNSS